MGVPPRPDFISVTQKIWDSMGNEAQDVTSVNGLLWEQYEEQFLNRISAHDAGCKKGK